MIVGDFVGFFQRSVEALSPWLDVAELNTRLPEIVKQRIYAISFPRVEKMNVLSHVNWGHEVGHILGNRWINTKLPGIWSAEKAMITQRLHSSLAAMSPNPLAATARVLAAVNETFKIAERGFSELLSDAVGVHLFGQLHLPRSPNIRVIGNWIRFRRSLSGIRHGVIACDESL